MRRRRQTKTSQWFNRITLAERRQWKRIRAHILKNEPLCRPCQDNDRVEVATQVDHIIPISQGGALLDIENLQPICNNCHRGKSANELHSYHYTEQSTKALTKLQEFETGFDDLDIDSYIAAKLDVAKRVQDYKARDVT